jgi:hypothetical protein
MARGNLLECCLAQREECKKYKTHQLLRPAQSSRTSPQQSYIHSSRFHLHTDNYSSSLILIIYNHLCTFPASNLEAL